MALKLPTDLPIHSFPTAQALEVFLEREHTTAPGFYLKFAKKASGFQSVSVPQAVETALCFGWIDGRANRFDQDWWLVRYTPRRAKSIWSQKNVNTAHQLIENGRMRPAGLAAVEAAKSDGRWHRAYAGSATIIVPDDFRVALESVPFATPFFETLNKTDRYTVLWRIETASPTSRGKRIDKLVQMLAERQVPTSLTSVGKRKRQSNEENS
ncbi:hypothetical protein N7466_010347 [Penicillium verhagenii]|uniref:uncharacterized protein n=1 Tax=Penicillium verhagenii TaxID=1562060 RepID=UPI00254525A2|nr:uncharacterized protein N7466_010347 [Penicillium verhagenii]KAJ5919404.1 hypothetical protein N7466_010347 [Penicillium verhagenii]